MTRDAIARIWNAAKIPAAIVVAGGLVATAVWMTRPRAAPDPRAAEIATAPRGDSSSAPTRGSERFDGSDPSVVSRRADPAGGSAPGSAPAPAVAAPAAGMPAGMPPASRAAVVQATEAATAAFEAERARARACWNALPEDDEAPASVQLDLSISYDADGQVLASGVSERRDGSRPGLATCLQPLVHELEVEPPGEHVSIQLTVTVP